MMAVRSLVAARSVESGSISTEMSALRPSRLTDVKTPSGYSVPANHLVTVTRNSLTDIALLAVALAAMLADWLVLGRRPNRKAPEAT